MSFFFLFACRDVLATSCLLKFRFDECFDPQNIAAFLKDFFNSSEVRTNAKVKNSVFEIISLLVVFSHSDDFQFAMNSKPTHSKSFGESLVEIACAKFAQIGKHCS